MVARVGVLGDGEGLVGSVDRLALVPGRPLRIGYLAVQDAAVPNWKSRTKVDTIFLVTDGAPTVGKVTDPSKLIAAITDINRSRGVTIHVIVFDKQEEVKLGPLAYKNGGQCVVRGWTGK